MLGDATYTSLPFAGNGAAQALEDAAGFNCLFNYVHNPEEIAFALTAFSEVRLPRSQYAVGLARTFGRVYAYADTIIKHEDPATMKSLFARAAAFTTDFDVKS
ncbi:hypothetical protein HD806DRAFT_491474 [Xylariaceae sp. AK1471]|nr:hypothetical protein HD806DRAFT_491474 [Xylariaceae sp. AK1471]